jgi:hypothetical protein
MKSILFIRKYPTCLACGRAEGLKKSFNSVFGNGQTEVIRWHKVIFFFPGYGNHTRRIPDDIVRGINSGEISDIVDFGAGGALNPALKVGDLFLSEGEVCCNGSELLTKTRPGTEQIVRRMARDLGRNFHKGKILTADKIVSSRSERLKYFEELNAGVVQMEHYWFVDMLKRIVDPKAFEDLHFTHIELVADEVPKDSAFLLEGIIAFFRALVMCVFRNDYYLGRLKVRFLSDFLSDTKP